MKDMNDDKIVGELRRQNAWISDSDSTTMKKGTEKNRLWGRLVKIINV